MKVRLLDRDRDFDWRWALQAAEVRESARAGRSSHTRDFDPRAGLPWNEDALERDLELTTLFGAMAGNDDCVFAVARKVVLSGVKGDLDRIRYRQGVLQDCLDHAPVVRELYALATDAMREKEQHYLGSFQAQRPDSILRWSIETLGALLASIERLRKISDAHGREFGSEGWVEFFATVQRELSDDYIAGIERHLTQLRFRNGILLSARLGKGNKGTDHILHPPPGKEGTWFLQRLKAWRLRFFGPRSSAQSFSLNPNDEDGVRMLEDLKNRGIAIASNALGQSADQVRDFFALLRTELAFYVGCVTLHEKLAEKGEPFALPSPLPVEERGLSFRGLYDVGLSLNLNQRVVGNDANVDRTDLVIVTGANQGGKSSFLRSVGLAQLMMQSGMFVPAESFSSSICDGLFTHYRREEDAEMVSGKFDEELSRMDEIIDRITPDPMILFNKSFAATNEREGSEIARQITSALLENRIRIVFVTHLYEFARSVYDENSGQVSFLRADRRADGTRTFRMIEGEPLQTSFGEDLYDKVFRQRDVADTTL